MDVLAVVCISIHCLASGDTQLLRSKGLLQNIIKGDDIARLGGTPSMKSSQMHFDATGSEFV